MSVPLFLECIGLSQNATSSLPHWNRACISGEVETISLRYEMIWSLSVLGTPTIFVTKPGLKKRLFQPVTAQY
jgi:hypothetical protein